MKQLTLIFALILGVVFSASANKPGKEKEVKIKTSAVCEMCKERIEKNLSLSKGISEAVLNLDDKVGDEIRETIEELKERVKWFEENLK